MADIHHRLRVGAPPEAVYRAITRETVLDGWGAAITASLVTVEDGTRLAWRCIDGPPGWAETDISFELAPSGSDTVLRFSHRNWRAPNDAMADCATRWASVLFGLKAWIETPEPDDVRI